MAERTLSSAESRAAVLAAARIVAYGMVIYVVMRVAGRLLDAQSMASIVAQAVIVELGLGRIGVAWSDPLDPVPEGAALAKRALRGVAVGLALAVGFTLFTWSTGAVLVSKGSPSLSPLVIGLIGAGLTAMRDELLLHGLVMRAFVSVRPALPRVVVCGVTSAAFAWGEGTTSYGVVTQGILGLVFGALWARDRGAWQAWGAHTAWLFGAALLLDGGLLDARTATNAWGGGDAGVLAGAASVVATLPFGVAALALAARGGRR